jgi:hypothetical protein
VGYLGIDVRGVGLARPIDEDAALQPGEKADDRPAGDLALGDERQGNETAEDGDVDPRDMIREDERRPPAGRRVPVDHDSHPEEAQEQAVEQDGKPAGKTPSET